MKEKFSAFYMKFFNNGLDLRVRIFNILAIAGIAGTIIIGLVNLFSGVGVTAVLVDAVAAVLSVGLLFYSYRTQKYQHCYLITIIVIFLGRSPTCSFIWAAIMAVFQCSLYLLLYIQFSCLRENWL